MEWFSYPGYPSNYLSARSGWRDPLDKQKELVYPWRYWLGLLIGMFIISCLKGKIQTPGIIIYIIGSAQRNVKSRID